MAFVTFAAYSIQMLTTATLILTLFINSALYHRPNHPQVRLITQINWMSLGAAVVAGLINITAILKNINAIFGISMFISVTTVALTAGCLFALRDIPEGGRGNNADDDRTTGATSPTDSTGAPVGRKPMPKPKK